MDIEKRNRMKFGYRPCIGLVGSSKNLIDWVKMIIDRNFPPIKREAMVGFRKNNNCYSFFVCGSRACIIIDYLRQIPVYKLPRKFENPTVLKDIQENKRKYPQYFRKYRTNSNKIEYLFPNDGHSCVIGDNSI